MGLNTSNLGSAFLHRTETNTPEQQSDQCETIRDNFPLEVGLQYLVDSNTVQIDSPDRLPDALRRSYIADNRERVLLTRDKQAFAATLRSFGGTHIVTRMKYAGSVIELAQKRHQPIVVVFSGDGDQRYILQGKVLHVGSRGVDIICRDPRYDTRFMVRLAEPGAIHALSLTKTLELVAETLEPVREITWLTPSKGRKKIVQIEDTLCVPEGETLYPQDYIDAGSAKEGVVENLSLGGAQLSLDEPLRGSADNQLLLVKLELPAVTISGQSTTLNILSILTESGCVDSKVYIHCRFIYRLPDDLENVFTRLQPQ